MTGAASGIGRETALALARRGADLAICDVDEAGLEETAEQIRQIGCRVLQSRVDVSSAEQMGGFAERTLAELGRVDVLVNNAGAAPLLPIDQTTDDVLLDAFKINAFAPIRLVALLWSTFHSRSGTGSSASISRESSTAATSSFPR